MYIFITIIFIALDNYTERIIILQSEQYIYLKGSDSMKELNFEKIGKKIKETRISRHLTQEYIANATDVNTSHISNIENNRGKVSLSTLVQICNAFDTTVDYILADEYNQPSTVIEHEILKEVQQCSLETQVQILKIIKALQ